MIVRYDIEYSLMREAVERAACEAAPDRAAKSSHARLADSYADRTSRLREQRRAVRLLDEARRGVNLDDASLR
ncbi:hypothetical protein [Sphingomonas faeni]|uniref:hypothetical protein n=1 Tax=Sphingomonas faeni TaxID=185950 RepID=UPI0033559809